MQSAVQFDSGPSRGVGRVGEVVGSPLIDETPEQTPPMQALHPPADHTVANDQQPIPLAPRGEANIAAFRALYPFPLDPFQEEAIGILTRGESVMVAAPTGTGKTVVAEYAVFDAMARQGRVLYTTPIKALS